MATKSYWQRLQRERISRRRLLGTAGAGAAGLVIVTACGGNNGPSGAKTTPSGTSTGVAKNGGRYLLATDVNVDSLDPHISIAGGPGYFPRVYNVPVKQSTRKTDFIFYDLAEDFEAPEPGGLEWIFTVRPGVKIAPNSFGIPEREMDAEDMRVSFERIKNLPQANACQFVCNYFESHEASADGKTYTVRTGKPYAYFLLNIGGTIYTATVAPREVIEKGDVGRAPGRSTATICRRILAAPVSPTSRIEPAARASATAVPGSSATPSPRSTIRFAASMLSTSVTPRGTTPASRNRAFVSS